MSDNVFADVVDNATWIEILAKLRDAEQLANACSANYFAWYVQNVGFYYVTLDDGRVYRVGLTYDPIWTYDVTSVHDQSVILA